jgi:beta-galactosidase GanA
MSASPAALEKFRAYCAQRYGDIATLNAAWGNVFWSMEYDSFDQIELPFFTVCETNPAHRLAYRRFVSEQVVRFHDVYKNAVHESGRWRETIAVGAADIIATYEDGSAAAARSGRSVYLATLTDDAFVKNLLVDLCAEAGVAITPLPPTLRLRRRGDLTFAFNLAETHAHAPAPIGAVFVIGGAEIEPFGVAVWR